MSAANSVHEQIINALESLQPFIASVCEKRAEEAVARWREAVITTGQWCCLNMAHFAAECFGMSRPQSDPMYRTTLDWRGMRIRYCPFCGVHVSREPKS